MNKEMPVKLSIPCINATSITRGLSHDPPKNHVINHTKFEPKCAYLMEKYKVLHMIIKADPKNITEENIADIRNSC